MDVATLFARIGIKADTKEAKSFMDQVKHLTISLGIATVSATAFIAVIKNIANESIATALSLKKFHAETGASTDELQRWQAVADEVNNSGQAVADSIKAITDNQEKIKLGQGNISGYQLLGINPRQDPFKIMEQLRQKTAGLSQAMKKNVLSQIGVSKDLIAVLDLTNAQFDEMAKDAFIIPKSTIDMIDKARASLKKVEGGVKYLKAEIIAALTPSIIKVNKAILEWIKNNKDGLIKTIKTIFEWITRIVGATMNAVAMINKIISATIGWKNAMYILLGVIAILNASLLLSPIGLIVAGIILLVGVLDDLYVYSKGGKSLFGELLANNPKLKAFTDGIIELAKAMRDLFAGDWTAFDKLMEKWGNWGKIIKGIADALAMISDPTEFFKGWELSDLFKKEKESSRYLAHNPSANKDNNNTKIDITINAEGKTADEIAATTTKAVQDGLNKTYANSSYLDKQKGKKK